MFWLSRVHEHSSYLTGVCLPLLVFAAAAGLIFVPLTMALAAGISDEHAGIASSMFNAGQQVGGAVVGRHRQHGLDDRQQPRQALTRGRLGPTRRPARQPVYDHALTSGDTAALTIGAAATVLALIATLAAIRIRREDFPETPLLANQP